MGDLIGNLIGAVLVVALVAGVFGFAVSLGVAFEESGGGLGGLRSRKTLTALALAALVLAFVAALPFIVPYTHGASRVAIGLAAYVVPLAGAYLVARRLRPGWSVMGSVGLLVVSVWLAGASTLLAYKSGWHGLDIRDVSGLDQGDGFEIGLAVAAGTVVAPLAGLVLGMLGSRRKEAV